MPVVIRPLMVSKLNTVLQIVLVAAGAAARRLGGLMSPVLQALIWLVTASTLASGAAYVAKVARTR